MKLSRDETGASLIIKLSKVGYEITRQKGSHIRLSRVVENNEHHITIPNHNPLKIGLLAKILNEVSKKLEISREELLEKIT
ncbi:MAG: type II toxin-antitoxin system HicA family toxin [Saprospiraceae bacterium]|jgi:predicted RNA binding protein YcfA (HicA-like mRNA interferase family)|nr:type II toxin-antitoxin system HicA family toxin [Saprospiraceae bacterium]MBL0025637.1 type II toxin-antitoxin system HicA family toxin [Saprospiraceae bacterium]